MHSKIIKSILRHKFDAFTKSIKDENTRRLVRNNSIITGGAIANLLIGEEVSDYDVYFTNKETALAVANYYVNDFKARHNDNLLSLSVTDKDGQIKIKVQSAGVAQEKAEEVKEPVSDFITENFEEINEFQALDEPAQITPAAEEEKPDKDKKPSQKDKFRPVYLTSNAITLSEDVQLILRFYGEPEEIHKNYDFVHATNYWVSSTGELVLRREALEALLDRRLVYIGSRYPVSSVIRVRKFLKRGFKIDAGQMLKMCFQISVLNMEDVAVLEEQLTGVDVTYFHNIIDQIRCDKERSERESLPFSFSYEYVAAIVDRIFGGGDE